MLNKKLYQQVFKSIVFSNVNNILLPRCIVFQSIFMKILCKICQKTCFLSHCIFPYKDRVYNSVLIWENTGQRKPIFLHILHSETEHTHPEIMFKVNNRNIRTRCEICSKLTIKTIKTNNGVVLVSLLLTLNIFNTLF